MSESEFVPPCDECGGKCCKYIAIEIGRPKTKTDFDHIRWYLHHENVNVFIDHDKKWFVEFRTGCDSQSDDNRCEIYNDRPKICREHGKEDGACEFYDNPFMRYFTNSKMFERYLEKKGIEWRFRNKK